MVDHNTNFKFLAEVAGKFLFLSLYFCSLNTLYLVKCLKLDCTLHYLSAILYGGSLWGPSHVSARPVTVSRFTNALSQIGKIITSTQEYPRPHLNSTLNTSARLINQAKSSSHRKEKI